MTSDFITGARDSIIRLATTPGCRGSVEAAAAELSARPGWQRRGEALAAGLVKAKAMVAKHGSAKAAEKAIDAAALPDSGQPREPRPRGALGLSAQEADDGDRQDQRRH